MIRQQGLVGSDRDKNVTRLRLEREKFWIRTLQTAYPFGMNTRVAGVGDFAPSQGVYQDFGGRRRRRETQAKKVKKSRRDVIKFYRT